MHASSPAEVWLQGPVPGVPPELMPVVHSLLQVREELAALAPSLSSEQLWARPGGAASVGFHVMHLAGSLDRLLTYARGDGLNNRQRAALEAEDSADPARESPPRFSRALAAIDRRSRRCAPRPSRRWEKRAASGGARFRRPCGGCCFTPPSTRNATRAKS